MQLGGNSLFSNKRKIMHQYHRIVEVKLPTNMGHFRMIGYQNSHPDKYHIALIKGNPEGKRGVLARIHSSCITGDIFGSLRCDCGQQLETAMDIINKNGEGIILYLFQEGRGIGLINKLKAYRLQEEGLDTVEANLQLGLPVDLRNYLPAAEILKDLKIKSVKLLTNNPDKIAELKKFGVNVSARLPLEFRPVKHNQNYLLTKKVKLGHLLSLGEKL